MTDDPGKTRRDAPPGARPLGNATLRRTFLRATGGAVLGTGLVGTAVANDHSLPPLSREGNTLVDPSGAEVILRGVNVVDPARQSRVWRRKSATETFELATDEEAGWYTRVVRIPCQPQDVATGVVDSSVDDTPHGDEWGPVLPGAFDEADLEWYCETFVDDLVDLGRERGAYVVLDYHRHYPVFHQEPFRDMDMAGIWHCNEDGGEDWRLAKACGERGILWHGEDQVDEIWRAIEAQDLLEVYDLEADDVYVEPPEVTNALDAEVRMFWSVVADRYAGEEHVIFDVYDEPTGPYEADWGAPDRESSPPRLPQGGADAPGLRDESSKRWWDLWRERAQPWVDTVEEHAPGHVVTIGSPRWSQYTYWAPENEFEAEHMCYTGHVFTQEDLRPLATYFGEPAERVPVFLSEFGWIQGGGARFPTPWMDCTVGDESPAEADCAPFVDEFEALFDEYPVHPIAWCFDHSWQPALFDGVAVTADDWMDHLDDDTPGQWWRAYLERRAGEGPPAIDDFEPRPAGGDGLYRDVDGSGSLGSNDVVVFFEHLEEPAVADYPLSYDFNGSGSVGFDDVVALFEQV